MRKYFYLVIILVLASCEYFHGSYSLGNNYFLIEGDRVEDRIVVFCTGKESKYCDGGISVIPPYNKHFVNGNYAEYVELAKSDKKWIIVRTIKIENKQKEYWIIDIRNKEKENTYDKIKSKVYGPFDYEEFLEKKMSKEIILEFSE